MLHNYYTNLTLIPGLSNVILKVEGNPDDTKRFFNMVASFTLSDHNEKIACQYMDNSIIGTFSSLRAVANLIKLNPDLYKPIFNDGFTINGDRVPYTRNTLVTSQKFNGDTIFFLVNNNCIKGMENLRNIIACYASEFPMLSFYISYKHVELVDPTVNEVLSISHIISQEIYSGAKSPKSCHYDAHRTAYYSEDPLKYRMHMGKIRPAKININADTKNHVYTQLDDKKIMQFHF